jgi:hypothetical protein
MADQAIVEEFLKLFQDQQLQQQFVSNQGAYIGEHFPPGCTPQDLAEGAQQALQSAGINQTAYAGYGGGAPPYGGGEAGLVQQIAYYTSVYNNTTIDDRDTTVNNQINALGDVDVDTNVASGDGAVAINESTLDDTGIATGDNATAAGDVEGSVAGAGGTAIGGDGTTVVDDSQIQSANAGGDVAQGQQDQDIDIDVDAPPPPPPPDDPADV